MNGVTELLEKELVKIETIFLLTEPSLRCVSSTVVRDLLKHNHPVNEFVPENIRISGF